MAKKKKKVVPPTLIKKLKRTHRKTILFNDKEIELIHSFCEKYKIEEHSKFFRETIISTILCDMKENHPKLF